MEPSRTHTLQYGSAHHGRRPRVRRRLGSPLLRARCADGRGALANADACLGAGLSHHLRRCGDGSISRSRLVRAAAAGRRSIPVELTPEISASAGNAILVFALPEARR